MAQDSMRPRAGQASTRARHAARRYTARRDAALRRPHHAERGGEASRRPRQRRLLRRDRWWWTRAPRTAPARSPSAAGARVVVANAPGRASWPSATTRWRRRATTGSWPWTPTSGSRPPCARRSRPCAPRGFAHAGYRIPRVAFYLGRWIRGTDWYPDPQLRLFDRRRGRWDGRARPRVGAGATARWAACAATSSITPTTTSPTTCARSTATRRCGRGRRTRRDGAPGPLDMALAPVWAFLRNYVLSGGFLLGQAGLTVSTLNAYYTYAKLAKLGSWRRQRRAARVKVLHVDTRRGLARRAEPGAAHAPGAWRPAGHEVARGLPRRRSPRGARARGAGSTSHPLAFRGDFSPPAALGLARLARGLPPEVVHAPRPARRLGRALAARVAGRRWSPTRRVDFPLRGPLSRRKYRRCARVIAVSRAIAALLAQGGVPRTACAWSTRACPTAAPSPAGAQALRGPRHPRGAPVVGNVAALTDHKDHATLLGGRAAVLRARSRAPLPDRRATASCAAPLEARARGAGPRRPRVFAGFRADLDALIPAFDVFCLSSRWRGSGRACSTRCASAAPWWPRPPAASPRPWRTA